MAVAFGLDVHRFIAVAVLAGSLVVAAAVAFGGLVAFVGLAAPHIARWLVGPLHRPLLPASALVGAIVVTLADAIARSALPPAEIPLGLVTAVAGGPFFILLLAAGCGHERARRRKPGRAAWRGDPARRLSLVPRPPARSPSSAPTAPASRRC